MFQLKKVAIGLAAVAIVSTAAVATPIFAQTAPQGDNQAEQRSPQRGDRDDRGDHARVIDRAAVKEVIATTLNMTVEELDAATQAGQTMEEIAAAQGVAFETVLNAAKASMTSQVNAGLAAGEITQEQADQMNERIANMDSLDKSKRGKRGDRGDRVNVIDRAAVKEVVATTLNMTVEELDAAKDAGQTMDEIAAAQGVAPETVLNAAKASMTSQVNAALAAGEITQEQANQMNERIENKDSLDKSRRGNRGNRGNRGGADGSNIDTDSTDDGESADPLTDSGSTLAAASSSVLVSDLLYLPSIAGGQN